MPTDTYVPVIDISEHQGVVDFKVMRDRGVEGLIIRSNHAQTVDKRCKEYVLNARLAGWHDRQLGFYTFCNPKRATGAASGKAFVDTVRSIFGRTDTILMLDIEGYETESGAGPVLKGPLFAAWIREHVDTVRELAPNATVIAYSNASFWNVWVGDQRLAAELEWIVPRYPVYTAAGYVLNPVPGPDGWKAWAWRMGPKGPIPPSGVPWAGWQFSAGFNRCGPVYGCQSSDLDLNIVRSSAWERWTHHDPEPPPPPPPPDEEVDMKAILYTVTTPDVGGAWFYVSPELNVRTLATVPEYNDWVAAGALEREASPEDFRSQLTTFQPVGALTVPAQNVLGVEASADWDLRASVARSAGSGGLLPNGRLESTLVWDQ